MAAGTRIELPARLVETYKTSCAGGKWVELASELHNAALPPVPAGKLAKASPSSSHGTASRSYVVKKGETLGAIAHKMGCGSVTEIASTNHLKAPAYALKPGQTLQVPACHK